jgi:hypothetical protein
VAADYERRFGDTNVGERYNDDEPDSEIPISSGWLYDNNENTTGDSGVRRFGDGGL